MMGAGKSPATGDVSGYNEEGMMDRSQIGQEPYWARAVADLMQAVGSSSGVLTAKEAANCLRQFGPNRLRVHKQNIPTSLFLNQFKSPIILILLFGTLISAVLKDWVDALTILVSES